MTENIKNSSQKVEHVFWTISKALSLLIVVVALSLKLYNSEFELKMDVPTLLSILLALFSVGLSATFYFKATDTSNKFYDNSYKYTKDVAQLLVKIESGFGERLKNLDAGYLSMKEEIQKMPVYGVKGEGDLKVEIEKTKKELNAEKIELEKIKKDRDLIIKSTIENSKLLKNEKHEILQKLAEKEDEVSEAQQQVMRLNKRLFAERMNRKKMNSISSEVIDRVESYTRDALINRIENNEDHDISTLPFFKLKILFRELSNGFPEEYFEDMIHLNYTSKDYALTKKGALFLRSLINENL